VLAMNHDENYVPAGCYTNLYATSTVTESEKYCELLLMFLSGCHALQVGIIWPLHTCTFCKLSS